MRQSRRIPKSLAVVVPGLILALGLFLGASTAQAANADGVVFVTKKNTNIKGTVSGIVVLRDGAHINLSQGTVDCDYTGLNNSSILGIVGIDITDRTGVHVNGSGTGTVQNCVVGIRIEGGSGNHINGVVVTNSGVGGIFLPGGGDGIFINDSSNNHINGNTSTFNDRSGVHVLRGTGNRINGNTLTNNGRRGDGGLFLDRTLGNTVHSNDVSANARFGIGLLFANANFITSNIVNDTRFGGTPTSGITLSGSNNNRIQSNEANRNAIGVELGAGSNGNEIRGNTTNNNLGVRRCVRFFFGCVSFAFGTAFAGGPTGAGIGVVNGSQDNTVQSNTALGNQQVDLSDGNPDCGTNDWRGNVFGTINQACVGNKPGV